MPLERFPIRDAIRVARRNSQNVVQARQSAKPAKYLDLFCEPSFKIAKADKLFTVGSCFARQIEGILSEFGFNLPALKIPADALGLIGKDTGVLNKYTPASIANEIRWAFDDFPGTPVENALVAGDGQQFWDSQLHVRMHPLVDRDEALSRRYAVREAFRSISSCQVAILTFGLVETWRDTQTGLFLNEAPPRPLMRDDRFQVTLFSFEECLREGRYILNKIFEVNPSINVLVTVSPVSLGSTFSSDPVVVRNCYSKSVLRAAVEHLRHEFPRIDYYPSYERVIYSDRETAFEDDEIHVSLDLTNHTVVSMLERYLETDITEFSEGAARLWWKAVFEGNGPTALALLQTHPRRIVRRLRRFPELKAEFDALVGPGSYDIDLLERECGTAAMPQSAG